MCYGNEPEPWERGHRDSCRLLTLGKRTAKAFERAKTNQLKLAFVPASSSYEDFFSGHTMNDDDDNDAMNEGTDGDE